MSKKYLVRLSSAEDRDELLRRLEKELPSLSDVEDFEIDRRVPMGMGFAEITISFVVSVSASLVAPHLEQKIRDLIGQKSLKVNATEIADEKSEE